MGVTIIIFYILPLVNKSEDFVSPLVINQCFLWTEKKRKNVRHNHRCCKKVPTLLIHQEQPGSISSPDFNTKNIYSAMPSDSGQILSIYSSTSWLVCDLTAHSLSSTRIQMKYFALAFFSLGFVFIEAAVFYTQFYLLWCPFKPPEKPTSSCRMTLWCRIKGQVQRHKIKPYKSSILSIKWKNKNRFILLWYPSQEQVINPPNLNLNSAINTWAKPRQATGSLLQFISTGQMGFSITSLSKLRNHSPHQG